MVDATERRRAVRWERQTPWDPALSGLERLQAVALGTCPAPPVASLIGLRLSDVAPGRVRAVLPPAEYHYNPIGSVHGGVIATMLDTVMTCAVLSTQPTGRTCVTLEIKVNYVRALTEASGEVTAEGTAVHSGRQVGVAEGRITDASGRIYATASTTILAFETSNDATPGEHPAGEYGFEWADPRPGAKAGGAMAGIDYLNAMTAGTLPRPPILALLGIDIAAIEPGRVTMTLPPGGHLTNPNGSMHGGMIATLLDSVLGCAVHTTVPTGRGYTTLELKVNYVRAITAGSGLITGTGQVQHSGRQVGIAEARAVDNAGRLCATASTTCLIFDRPAAR